MGYFHRVILRNSVPFSLVDFIMFAPYVTFSEEKKIFSSPFAWSTRRIAKAIFQV